MFSPTAPAALLLHCNSGKSFLKLLSNSFFLTAFYSEDRRSRNQAEQIAIDAGLTGSIIRTFLVDKLPLSNLKNLVFFFPRFGPSQMGLVSRRTCALQVRLAAACPTQALLGLQCVLECKLPKWWPACSGRSPHPLLTGKRVAGEPSQGGL